MRRQFTLCIDQDVVRAKIYFDATSLISSRQFTASAYLLSVKTDGE
jgi:hypothetical protein